MRVKWIYFSRNATGLGVCNSRRNSGDQFQEEEMRRGSEIGETAMSTDVVCDSTCRTFGDPIYKVLEHCSQNSEVHRTFFESKQVNSDTEKTNSVTSDSHFDSGYCSSVPLCSSTDMDTEKISNLNKSRTFNSSDMYRTDEEIHKRLSAESNFHKHQPCSRWEEPSTTDSGLGVDMYSSSEVDIEYPNDKESLHLDQKLKQTNFGCATNLNFTWNEALQQDEDGDTLLHLAIIEGIGEVVCTIIQLIPHPVFLDIFNSLWQTPLHLAVLTDQPYLVRRLVVAGASLDIQDRNGNTPLHLACANGSLDCVHALVTSVHESEILEAKLLYSVSIPRLTTDFLEMKNFDGQCSIHLAVSGIHTRVIRYLVQCGADINARDGKSGRTALHYAAEKQKTDIIKFLLVTCRARATATNYAGLTPLHIAWYHHKVNPTTTLSQVVTLLKEHSGELFDMPKTDSETDSDITLEEDMNVSAALPDHHMNSSKPIPV